MDTDYDELERKAMTMVLSAVALMRAGSNRLAAQLASDAYMMAPIEAHESVDLSIYEGALAVYNEALRRGGLSHDDIK